MNLPRVPASPRPRVGTLPSSGLILLDKSPGPTSHDAVLWARRAIGHGRVGHCGSLDPFAGGLLLLGVGETLKWQDKLTSATKTYSGTLRFGTVTDTDDITGKPLPGYPAPVPDISEQSIRDVLRLFVGRQKQTVPRYSAVKVQGRPLYAWARAGVQKDCPEKEVEIFRLDFLRYNPPDLDFFVECSKGTYVRALARDIGARLGVGATLASLSRESVGPFSRNNAYLWKGERETREHDLQRSFLSLDSVLDLLRSPLK